MGGEEGDGRGTARPGRTKVARTDRKDVTRNIIIVTGELRVIRNYRRVCHRYEQISDTAHFIIPFHVMSCRVAARFEARPFSRLFRYAPVETLILPFCLQL